MQGMCRTAEMPALLPIFPCQTEVGCGLTGWDDVENNALEFKIASGSLPVWP